jgi:predicted transposase/invertase (TIGR01784 family)
MNTFIDPTSDTFVIFLLGSPEHKEILLDFINSVLKDSGFDTIVDVEIQNPFNIKKYSYDKLSILDVKATDSTGRIYDIEVQTLGNEIFINRSLYYWAKNYANQMVESESYIQLKPVICINLLKFNLFKHLNKVHTCFMPYEKDLKKIPLTDHFQIHFIELPKFNKSKQIKESLANWLEFFKIEGQNKEAFMQTLLEKNQIIKKAHEKYKVFTQSDELRELYEARLKYQRDQATLLEIAEKKGIEQGLKKGKKEGIKEGIKEKALDDAQKMLEKGLDINLTAEITGLDVKEIQKNKF